jgi:hypothetical protein
VIPDVERSGITWDIISAAVGGVEVMLFEPAEIKHTGDVESELTVHEFERI